MIEDDLGRTIAGSPLASKVAIVRDSGGRQTGSRIQKRVPPPLRGSNPIDP